MQREKRQIPSSSSLEPDEPIVIELMNPIENGRIQEWLNVQMLDVAAIEKAFRDQEDMSKWLNVLKKGDES